MATLSITTTPAEDVILRAAFGRKLNLRDETTGQLISATASQTKQAVIQLIKEVVREHNIQVAVETAAAESPVNPT